MKKEKGQKEELVKVKKVKRKKNFIYYLLLFNILILVIIILLMIYCISFYVVTDANMEPVLSKDNVVIVAKNKKVEQGDVILFNYNDRVLISRVIAMPGDVVNLSKDNELLVNNMINNGKYLKNRVINDFDVKFPYTVQDNCYFVLNDSNENYLDSRYEAFGCISDSQIIGIIEGKIWPIWQ